MIRKRGIVIFIVMTFLVIGGLFLTDSFSGGYQDDGSGEIKPGLRGQTSSIVDPLVNTIDSFRGLFEEVDKGFSNIRELRDDNERLRVINNELMIQQQLTAKLQSENDQLREMLAFSKESEYRLIPCRVVRRDPANWWGSVFVNKGKIHNTADYTIKPDLPVVTPRGIVGKTGLVTESTTQIILLVDPRCKISGIIQETGTQGIVMGDRNFDALEPQVRMRYIHRKALISEGEFVLTSGLGGVFPPGLKIGIVKEVPPLDPEVDFALYREAIIEPLSPINNIDSLFILVDKKRVAPTPAPADQ